MQVELSVEEKNELVSLVEKELGDTRIEVRRTRNPGWQENLHNEESLLASILDKLKME